MRPSNKAFYILYQNYNFSEKLFLGYIRLYLVNIFYDFLLCILNHFLVQKYLETVEQVQVLSDSKYSIDCITKWAKGWQTKGWTRGKGEEIKNVNLIKECFSLYQEIKQKLVISHVKGHANIEGNELSDRMAVLARKQQQESLIKYPGDINIKAILAMDSG